MQSVITTFPRQNKFPRSRAIARGWVWLSDCSVHLMWDCMRSWFPRSPCQNPWPRKNSSDLYLARSRNSISLACHNTAKLKFRKNQINNLFIWAYVPALIKYFLHVWNVVILRPRKSVVFGTPREKTPEKMFPQSRTCPGCGRVKSWSSAVVQPNGP